MSELRKNDALAADMPVIGYDVEFTPADISPLQAAEAVPLEVLEATSPARKIAKITGLIEQAYHGYPERLDAAAEEIERQADSSKSQGYAAKIHKAYLPIYGARVEARRPTDDEMAVAFEAIHILLASRPLVTTAALTRLNEMGSVQDQATLRGLAAEATALYLSLHSALTTNGQVLYPSSFREDNPPIHSVAKFFGKHTHDVHTYNPDNPNDRVCISVKAFMTKTSGQSAARFRLLKEANFAYYGQLAHTLGRDSVLRLDMPDVMDLLLASEDVDSPNYVRGRNFRVALSARLQTILSRETADTDEL